MACIAEIDNQSLNEIKGRLTDTKTLDLYVGVGSEITRSKLKDDFHRPACDASGHLYRKFYHATDKQEHQ